MLAVSVFVLFFLVVFIAFMLAMPPFPLLVLFMQLSRDLVEVIEEVGGLAVRVIIGVAIVRVVIRVLRRWRSGIIIWLGEGIGDLQHRISSPATEDQRQEDGYGKLYFLHG
jgi:hypothetical protein